MKSNYTRIYIPILRGLIHLNESMDDLYKNKISNLYFGSQKGNFSIFTGLNSYELIKKGRLGNLRERREIEEFERYLSENFFDNKSIEIIPSDEKKVLVIKIGEEQEQPIHHLGDGIQSIIIITLQLFLNQNTNLLLFIEEPEKYLHPGLQRKLIETFFLPKFSNCQYFITTHSNHFLDITIDYPCVSIYSIQKDLPIKNAEEVIPNFLVQNISNNDNSVLDLIGVRNSSVYLSNCTIWVEGITDRLYIQRFLKLFFDYICDPQCNIQGITNRRRYNEDYHYSFVEYGGSNITHWSFLEGDDPTICVDRLCAKIFLIADLDNPEKGNAKKIRHEKLRVKLGDRFFLLDCREIENILSPGIINRVLSKFEGNDETNEYFQNIDDYKKKPLGREIDKRISKFPRKREYEYKTPSGTIKEKIKFCRQSLQYLNSWNDLSDDAKDLTITLCKFISVQNS